MLGWWSLAVGRLEVTDDLCFFIRVIQKMSRKLQADQTVSSESRFWFFVPAPRLAEPPLFVYC